MGHVDIEFLIKEVRTLAESSENIAKSLLHKVEELRYLYREDIAGYRELKNIIEGGPTSLNLSFKMALNNGSWIVSIPGKPDLENCDLIPLEIKNFIVSSVTDVGILHMENIEICGKRHKLHFERKREGLITGAIEEEKQEKKAYSQNQKEKENSHKPPQSEKTDKLREFLSYMMRDKDFFDYLMKRFQLLWKPLIDGNKCFEKINGT